MTRHFSTKNRSVTLEIDYGPWHSFLLSYSFKDFYPFCILVYSTVTIKNKLLLLLIIPALNIFAYKSPANVMDLEGYLVAPLII